MNFETRKPEREDEFDEEQCDCCWSGVDYAIVWIGIGICIGLIIVAFSLGIAIENESKPKPSDPHSSQFNTNKGAIACAVRNANGGRPR